MFVLHTKTQSTNIHFTQYLSTFFLSFSVNTFRMWTFRGGKHTRTRLCLKTGISRVVASDLQLLACTGTWSLLIPLSCPGTRYHIRPTLTTPPPPLEWTRRPQQRAHERRSNAFRRRWIRFGTWRVRIFCCSGDNGGVNTPGWSFQVRPERD